MTTPIPLSLRPDAKGGRSTLLDKLASVLPKGYKFGVYHLSTPPTRTDALCSAPPGERPDKTYWENHFLSISINTDHSATAARSKRTSPATDQAKEAPTPVLILALEIFIFTTAYSTTLFVSKADSTGYLQLLQLPKGTPSPIREISAAFVAHLLQHRQRKNIQSVVSLFARAQDQYLFPLSVKNTDKHVLDDRGLVRWWCRVLNALLEEPNNGKWEQTKGYLIVPGLEDNEMRAFLPRTPIAAANWVLGHPLEQISHYTGEFDWVPPRCLIPRYPDDPKSRFRDELDEEAAKWKQDMGSWKSVKNLSQFWEMMAFRQECSSGRLTGFIWVVFDPPGTGNSSQATLDALPSSSNKQLVTPSSSFSASMPVLPPATPPRRRIDLDVRTPSSSPLKLSLTPRPTQPGAPEGEDKKAAKKNKKKLVGRIVPRQPQVKKQQRNYLLDRPTSTAYYSWPSEARGEKIVDETEYKRIVELLLHLDFSTLEKATGSSQRWISEVGMGGPWGKEVVGKRLMPEVPHGAAVVQNTVTNLSGLLRKNPKPSQGDDGHVASVDPPAPVNILGAGLVRKKRKENELPDLSGVDRSADKAPAVNALGAGLVRKKAKPS